MYRFDLNRLPILWTIGHQFKSNLYIPVYHTNRRPIRNTIGVIKNRLVGTGLKSALDMTKTMICNITNYITMFLSVCNKGELEDLKIIQNHALGCCYSIIYPRDKHVLT